MQPAPAWEAPLRSVCCNPGASPVAAAPACVRRDLYIIFLLKVLESYSYFSMSRVLTLYLTEELGTPDLEAGTLYGLWGTLLVLWGFVLGPAIDSMGVKRSLLLCMLLNLCSRAVMAVTRSRAVFLAMLCVPSALAGALGVPVMTSERRAGCLAGPPPVACPLHPALGIPKCPKPCALDPTPLSPPPAQSASSAARTRATAALRSACSTR